MKKLIYRNLTFTGKKEYITSIPDMDDLTTKEYILDTYHRYMGNHIIGHGIAEYEIYDINREVPENLQYELDYHKRKIEYHQSCIDELNEANKEPYQEKFLYKKQIGSVPTKDELLKDGWTEEQINTALTEIVSK